MVFPQERFFHRYAQEVYEDFYLRELKAEEKALACEYPQDSLGFFLSRLNSRSLSGRALTSGQKFRVIFAPGIEREAKEICREILWLVREQGIRFEEVGVLVRDFNTYRPHLERAFSRYGIPYFLGEKKPLEEFPVIQCLKRLLKVIEQDYSRESVISFLTHQAVKDSVLGVERELVGLFELVSIEARIVGMEEWSNEDLKKEYLDKLTKKIQKAKKEPEQKTQINLLKKKLQSAKALFKLTQELISEIEELKKQKSFSGLCQSLKSLTEKYLNFDFSPVFSSENYSPKAVSQLLEEIWEEIARLDQEDFSATWEDFISLVEQGLKEKGVWIGGYAQGKVCLSELMSARGVRFRVLILPGLNEGSFPVYIPESPLLTDDEREIIKKLYFPEAYLALKRNQVLEDRLLFYLACHQAEEYLILTCSWLDISSGKSRPVSYLLVQALSKVLGKELEVEHLEESLKGIEWVRWVGLLELYPTDSRGALEPEEWEASQLGSARIEQFSHLKKNSLVDRISQMAYERWLSEKPGIYSGYFSERRDYCPGQFSLLQRSISYSQIKDYLECPFKYFLKQVLGIEVLEKPEWRWEVSPLERGSFLHFILEKAFQRIKTRQELSTPEDWKRLLRELIEQEGREELARSSWLVQSLFDMELEEYFSYLVSWYEALLPDPEYNYWETEVDFYKKPVELEIEPGKTLNFVGKIDRLDLRKEPRRFSQGGVVDYKSGSHKKDLLTTSQLLIYLLAVENIFGIPKEKLTAKFLFIKPEGLAPPQIEQISGGEIEEKLEKFKEMVNLMLEGIERGIFYILPEEKKSYCEYCDYQAVCLPERENYSQKSPLEIFQKIQQLRNLK